MLHLRTRNVFFDVSPMRLKISSPYMVNTCMIFVCDIYAYYSDGRGIYVHVQEYRSKAKSVRFAGAFVVGGGSDLKEWPGRHLLIGRQRGVWSQRYRQPGRRSARGPPPSPPRAPPQAPRHLHTRV